MQKYTRSCRFTDAFVHTHTRKPVHFVYALHTYKNGHSNKHKPSQELSSHVTYCSHASNTHAATYGKRQCEEFVVIDLLSHGTSYCGKRYLIFDDRFQSSIFSSPYRITHQVQLPLFFVA